MDYLALVFVFVSTCVAGPPKCHLAEFPCDSGRCVALDRFCNGEDDCGDKSDEPRYCTPCNRTFYGEVGRTYEVEIRRPREDRLPFLCHLNFTAAGGDLGDLVQLTFDTFTVGKFVSFTSDGCPEGHMTIREESRPPTGGQWCGSAWGYTVYYSESRSLNLTLQLYQLSEQGIGYNFDFKLAYKFLRRSEAHLRYGNSTMQPWRGDLMPGTYCDRVLDRCDSRPCRVQSPNFPGVYPRNVTCYYRIEQRAVPRDKHALLAVRQRNTHKIHIKDQIVKYDRSQRVLKVWDQCNVIQDYLTVYNGPSTADPVLIRLCGGDVVPDIVSSGPHMLLEFHTSAYDNPFHPVPLSYLPGFELEVQVIFVNARSNSYVHDSSHCEFLISSLDSQWGVLENPKHSLPPNTTCRYNFQGRRQETVWISFIKYYASNADLSSFDLSADCNTRLRLWDGRLPAPPKPPAPPAPLAPPANLSLLGDFCRDDVPRLCDHALLSNATRFTRPCTRAESYVSSGPHLTLDQHLRQGSALFPFSFILRYEFVDASQEGDARPDSPCDRVFNSSRSPPVGRFHSPRSVFLFGRGGAQNISCVLRFEAAPDERLKLTLTRAGFGRRHCLSRRDPRTDRLQCVPRAPAAPVAELWLSEYPWPGVQLLRDCLCSPLDAPLPIGPLTSPVVELNFTVTLMNITQDFNDFFFEGEYHFLPRPDPGPDPRAPHPCPASRENRRLTNPSGEIRLSATDPPPADPSHPHPPPRPDCLDYPWLIEPQHDANFIFLKTYGFELPPAPLQAPPCPTRNRIIIYPGLDTRRPKVICPANALPLPRPDHPPDPPPDPRTRAPVQLFSHGWNSSSPPSPPSPSSPSSPPSPSSPSSPLLLLKPHARSFIVEFLHRETGNHIISWMEVSKRPLLSPNVFYSTIATHDCQHMCPELDACISPSLWCDGFRHCPSGFDEDEGNCAFQFDVPILYVLTIAGALAALFLLTLITICVKYHQHRRNQRKKKNQNANHLHVNHIHSSSDSYGLGLSGTFGGSSAVGLPLPKRFPTPAHDDLYMVGPGVPLDGKDSLC